MKSVSLPLGSWKGFSYMADPKMIDIVVNDKALSIAAGSSVTDLLKSLDIRTKAIAVEINRNVIPGDRHSTTVLGAGDRLEVVTLVGGG